MCATQMFIKFNLIYLFIPDAEIHQTHVIVSGCLVFVVNYAYAANILWLYATVSLLSQAQQIKCTTLPVQFKHDTLL